MDLMPQLVMLTMSRDWGIFMLMSAFNENIFGSNNRKWWFGADH